MPSSLLKLVLVNEPFINLDIMEWNAASLQQFGVMWCGMYDFVCVSEFVVDVYKLQKCQTEKGCVYIYSHCSYATF